MSWIPAASDVLRKLKQEKDRGGATHDDLLRMGVSWPMVTIIEMRRKGYVIDVIEGEERRYLLRLEPRHTAKAHKAKQTTIFDQAA